MKNTPAVLPIEQRETEVLVEDLCLALRDVGVSDYDLPEGEQAVSAVLRVQQLHSELSRRGTDIARRLERLSEETSWQMMPLLRDCLMYPDVIPYVRERDGIRRALRCPACRERELSRGEVSSVWLCDACKAELAASGVSGLMRVKITFADLVTDELSAQSPFEAVLLREFPGTGYWVAALPKPLCWLSDGNETSVRHLLLSARWVGTRIGRGIRDLLVDIAYVVDESLLADATLDFKKYKIGPVGLASDLTGAA
jgi:ribosomal protein L37AE/L43A